MNLNLEDDTLYTIPFTYDSLCSYQIVSDTIVQDDCGLIVGIEEQGGWGAGGKETRGQGDKGNLVIWPNPAGRIVNCQVSSVDERSKATSLKLQASVVVYDVFGRSAPTPALPQTGEGVWSVDISTLPPGIYFIVVRDERAVIGTGKFVVAR